MIRVLHVVTHLGRGGLETMIMNYYRKMDLSKIQFDFLVQGDKIYGYEGEIEKLGGKIYRIKPINHFFPYEFEKNLYKFFKEHKEYQIVHSHINSFSKYVLKAAKKVGIKNRIAHSHIALTNKGISDLYKNITKIGINKYTTKRFACSKEAGKWLYGNGEFEVLPNAIEIENFYYNEKLREEYRKKYGVEDKFVLCNIGRFTEQKNHIFLFEILKEINKKKDAVLILIGDGNLKDEYQRKLRELEIEDKVIFTGVVNNVHEVLNAADTFVFPSKFEGLGIVLIEAQANGLKCYASDNIPKEVNITESVKFISLNNNAEEWANEILNGKFERTVNIEKIKASGYDINESAKKLQKYYMEVIK